LAQLNEKIGEEEKKADPENMFGANVAVSETLKASRKKDSELEKKQLEDLQNADAKSISDISDAGYEMSPAKIDAGKSSKISEKEKKVEAKDLITELRHKYITILKSIYWEHFEDG
tara:strand:+ start:1133 stop:1480 length:348 start_codon:yes stop_codon:yes gene_type:complete